MRVLVIWLIITASQPMGYSCISPFLFYYFANLISVYSLDVQESTLVSFSRFMDLYLWLDADILRKLIISLESVVSNRSLQFFRCRKFLGEIYTFFQYVFTV